MSDSLNAFLETFCSKIAGELMELDGPYRLRNGRLVWYAVLRNERVRTFRSSERARKLIHEYNSGVCAKARIESEGEKRG